jgi:hypothetical protein
VYDAVTAAGGRGTRRVPQLVAAPSPFSLGSRVSFALPETGHARLTVYDARGRRVATLVDETLGAGDHAFRWDGHNHAGSRAPSGVYFAVLDYAGRRSTQRLVLLR